MNHYKTQPPWEFLLSASRNSLQSYELSRLGDLRKEIGALLDLWMEENSAAMLARWLMEQRERRNTGSKTFPLLNLSREANMPCPIIFLRIARPRHPQTEAPLKVKAIFRRSIRGLQPAPALTKTRSLGPGGVPSVMRPSGIHPLAPAFQLNASHNRARRPPSTSIAAVTFMRLSPDLRLSCLIFIRGR